MSQIIYPGIDNLTRKLGNKKGRRRLRRKFGVLGAQKKSEDLYLSRLKHRGIPGYASY